MGNYILRFSFCEEILNNFGNCLLFVSIMDNAHCSGQVLQTHTRSKVNGRIVVSGEMMDK